MKLLKRSTIAVALALMMAFAAFLAIMPVANAEYVEWQTFAYIIVTPDVVGVNQNIIVQFRIDKVVPGGTVLGPFWTGFTVKITKPDGTVETRGPLTADATGGSWFIYTPTQVGTYTFQTIFPGQWVNTTTPNRWYKPSTSKIASVTVQQQPVEAYPTTTLPADYWKRPIYGETKNAWQVADNWPLQGYDYHGRTFAGATAFAPYTSAPESPHIMWVRPIMFGGVVGGPYGDKAYYTGLSYEQPYVPLIIQGRIIYVEAPQIVSPQGGTYCVDLYTGETVWYLNGTTIDYAQLFDYESPNEHGIVPLLVDAVGSTWDYYNPFDGKYLFSMANVSTGYLTVGPNGEFLIYSFTGSGANRRLLMWNSTRALEMAGAINNPALTGTGRIPHILLHRVRRQPPLAHVELNACA